MKYFSLLASLLFISILATAQVNIQWEMTYGDEGDEGAHNIIQAKDGGFFIVGYTDSQGNGKKDGWVVKVKADGSEEWDVTFGGPKDEELYDLIELDNGDLALIGYTESQGKGKEDLWFMITDKEGNVVFNKVFGGDKKDIGTQVLKTHDGDYLLMGFTESKGPGKRNFWIMKYKPKLGQDKAPKGPGKRDKPVWDRYVGGAKYESCHKMVINPLDTMIYVIGQTSTYSKGSMDVYLITLDNKLGRVKDRKSYGAKQFEAGHDIILNEDGSFMMFGASMTNSNGLTDGYMSFVFKDHFYQEWQKTYGGEKDDQFKSAVKSDKGYMVVGFTASEGNGGYDGWVMEIDKDGLVISDETFGDAKTDKLFKIIKTKDGGYLMCGITNSTGAGGNDMWVIKVEK